MVPGQQQMNGASGFIQHRCRIAAGIRTIIPDFYQRSPGLPIVRRTLHHQINIAGIAATILACFGKGNQRTVLGANQGRYSVAGITLVALPENIVECRVSFVEIQNRIGWGTLEVPIAFPFITGTEQD